MEKGRSIDSCRTMKKEACSRNSEINFYQIYTEGIIYIPVDTGSKLNVHKTFRRRPERLLNILCKFNLRPVSTGIRLSLICSCINQYDVKVFQCLFK